jgi:polar amino acid transport system substrate-binding protein
MHRRFTVIVTIAVSMLFLAACGDETEEPGATETTPATASPATELVASVPDDELVRPGYLVACMDMPYPPMQFYDDEGNPIGIDVELLTEAAARIGLEPVYQNSVYDTIITALKTEKCDVIWADQLITPEREAELTMIPYWKSAEVFVVLKGNPEGLSSEADLCGKSAGGQTGALEITVLEDFSKECEADGKEPIDIQAFPKSPDALQALQAGHVDVYVTGIGAGSYMVKESPDQFEISYTWDITEQQNIVGVSVMPEKTNLAAAIEAALKSLVDDGTYETVFAKWEFEGASIYE